MVAWPCFIKRGNVAATSGAVTFYKWDTHISYLILPHTVPMVVIPLILEILFLDVTYNYNYHYYYLHDYSRLPHTLRACPRELAKGDPFHFGASAQRPVL